ncbi:MAG: L-serine ammonia-lyase [Rhodospirillales bacterium]|nr:L-serine ammonia-lyase [Rhodospirillales bacterium]
MFLSVFEIFKIGVGPSSSHTTGPMVAAGRFLDLLGDLKPQRIRVELFGALALTGRGHGTDRAVALGLLGCKPETLDPDTIEALLSELADRKNIALPRGGKAAFDPTEAIEFRGDTFLPGHANALSFTALDGAGAALLAETYYSIGGGFVVDGAELVAGQGRPKGSHSDEVPYPYKSAAEMLEMGVAANLTIAEMKRANEVTFRSNADLDKGLDALWDAMHRSIQRGLSVDGVLPGGLGVKRRAKRIMDKLQKDRGNEKFPHTVMDWISVYAIAVNEENASGGRIVTAPTNGAAGIIPAVVQYYLDFCPSADQAGVRDCLLVAASIGGLIKYNASISGAEVGCQGEVGSASAMAAAGLCAALGGSNAQVENAAEIALEHHLGMTCDPIGGLVQVPCIERNAMGAVKAINAASLALKGDGSHFVPLDKAIATMKATGADMLTKYKETSQGGLAVNMTEC